MHGATIERPPWRRRAVRLFAAAVVVSQVLLSIRGYWDPHKLFAFQPFNESSEWQADIVRVTTDGRRVPIEEPWPGGYRWEDLVDWRVLDHPAFRQHAYSGVDATVDFLDKALDWVADHTPDDAETRYLEAEVTYWRNTRGPTTVVLRSDERSVDG